MKLKWMESHGHLPMLSPVIFFPREEEADGAKSPILLWDTNLRGCKIHTGHRAVTSTALPLPSRAEGSSEGFCLAPRRMPWSRIKDFN